MGGGEGGCGGSGRSEGGFGGSEGGGGMSLSPFFIAKIF